MENKRSILVPHDFTQVGDFALEHAYMIRKVTNVPINLLHVIKKDSMYNEAFEKLESIAKNFSEKHNITVNPIVMKGNLYKTIYKCGVNTDAYISVMGTHGIKTIKKAMKVVKKFMKIPFILVQSPVIYGEYNKVVIPLDSNAKSRVKFQWVKYLNNLFKCKAYIISHEETDSHKKQMLRNNIRFANKFLEESNIDFEIKKLDSSKNFADEIYSYANVIESNIIMVMSSRYSEYAKNIKKAQNFESYKKIPIMCVNPRTDVYKTGGFN